MPKLTITLNYKLSNLILSAVLMIAGLVLIWVRSRDPMLVLGVLLVSAALNLRFEKDKE